MGITFALALGVGCYAPALHAYFIQDDFAFLAMGRLLHQPWLLFVDDHFPGSMYFRPLGILLWYLVCRFAEAAAAPQYLVNLILHLACVGALYTLLQRLRPNGSTNALWVALYAVHPLAIGTALWLSDRFDLLTTFFTLLACNAAFKFVQRPRTTTLAVLLVWLLLGLLAKELGVVAPAVAFSAIILAPRTSMSQLRRWAALAAIAALTLSWLAYRHAVLTPIGNVPPMLPGIAVFAQGFVAWLKAACIFILIDPRASPWSLIALVFAVLIWLIGVCTAFRPACGAPWRWHIAAALAVLILLPGLVQAPVAASHLAGIGEQTFWFHLVVASRFFHLALAGLICALMLATPEDQLPSSVGTQLIRAGVALAIIAEAPIAHAIAHVYASGTRAQTAALMALETALDRNVIPAQHCQIYFLQTASLAGFSGYSDAIAKGLSAQPERIAHCLISTERAPWTYFVRSGSITTADFFPLHPLKFAGNVVPTLTIGDLQIRYFTMGTNLQAALPAEALFFEYRDGAFLDVGAAVRSGARTIPFVTTAD